MLFCTKLLKDDIAFSSEQWYVFPPEIVHFNNYRRIIEYIL